MDRVWNWAMIDPNSDGRVVASVPDLDDVAASATTTTEKDALAQDRFGQPLSTVRRQAGILMDVHSALSQGTF